MLVARFRVSMKAMALPSGVNRGDCIPKGASKVYKGVPPLAGATSSLDRITPPSMLCDVYHRSLPSGENPISVNGRPAFSGVPPLMGMRQITLSAKYNTDLESGAQRPPGNTDPLVS